MYSFIIPVFNAEQYLSRCIDSILGQTCDNFEIVIVDDGSTDGTADICDAYSKKDTRIRVFHKPNGGVSSARNLGLEKAAGNKIIFIDADDYFDKDLLQTVSAFDSDMIVFNAPSNVSGEVEVDIKVLNYDYFCGRLGKLLKFAPCNKVYSKRIVDSVHLRFDERIKIGEDMLFNYDYLRSIKRLIVVGGEFYHYNIHYDSAMNNWNKDYLCDYEKTLSSLEGRIKNDKFVLSSWCLDVSALLFVRTFFSAMSFSEFKKYMTSFEKTSIYKYTVACTDKKSSAKRFMLFCLRHKCYRALHAAIKRKCKSIKWNV